MPDLPIASAATLNHTTIASGDLFPVLDISAASGSKGSKITFGELFNGVPLLGAANVFTTGQTINAPSGFTSSIFDVSLNSASRISVPYNGPVILQGATGVNASLMLRHPDSYMGSGAIITVDGAGGMDFCNNMGTTPGLGTKFHEDGNSGNYIEAYANGSFGALSSSFNLVNFGRSTTAQKVRINETFTDTSNYAGLAIITTAGSYSIKPEAAGTGTLRTLNISGLPTSASGLPSGTLWNNLGIVNVA